jgi:ATP-binding cassette subfamily B protein
MDFRKPRDTKGTLRKVARLLSAYKWGFIAVIILAVASVLFQTLAPYVLGLATNTVADGISAAAAGTGGVSLARLRNILLLLGGVYVLSAALQYIQAYVLVGVSQKLTYNLTRDIQKKLRFLPLRYFDNTAYGDILSRVTNDVSTLTQSLQQNLPSLFTSLLTLVMVLAAMLALSPVLTVVGLITLPLSFLFTIKSVKFSQKFFRGQQKGLGDMSGHVEEMFTGHSVIKAYGREADAIAEFERINGELSGYTWKSQFISGLMMPVTMFFSNLGYVLVAILGGIAVATRGMQIGTIQSFIQYLRQFSQPVMQIANLMNMLQSTIAAAERVFDFLEEEEEPLDCAEPAVLAQPKGEVSFEHVRFGYSPDRILMKDISIHLKSGDKVAIVGPTGAGKTTLVNLLLRFYDIQGGRITVDGVDIMRMKRRELRSLFGMVLQDTWLFSGSVEENIRYGRPDATDEEVRQAARSAYVDAFIRTQPGGYQMELGEEADNISGGQRQLLTIARAILSNPAILILDEATSSVDTRTEVLIQRAMERLMENRTSFVIAHRLSTIRDAQMILVMNEGDIVETGTHDKLLAAGGFYAKLYNSQFVAPAAEAG